MNKYIFLGLGIMAFIIYLKLRLFSRRSRDYDRLYHEILTSDKYKVKGQYD